MAQVEKLPERLPLTPKPWKLKIGRELNRGAYGVVYEGVFAGQQVAVKGVHKLLLEAEGGENPLRNFCEECERLKELEHPHVIKFLGAFKDARLGPILVMERMKENLQEFLENHVNKLTIQEQIRISHEIAQGVAFLHQLNPSMVHRDLNDKNVMFTFDGVVKIGDFGQSKLKLKLHLTTAQPGMVLYMPPEALQIEQAQYDESLDIFSLGVLMLQIGIQQQPLVNMLGIGTVPEVRRREKDLQKISDLHPLKPFILLCLSDDQTKRPKATELEMVLPRLKETILQTMIAAEERFCRMRDVQIKEELTAAKLKMDRMMNALKAEYQSNLKKKDEEILILRGILEERSQKQKDWEDQLASMSQEHECLTGEVLMLKEQLVAIGTTERDVQIKEELTAAKLEMDRMVNALEEEYQSNLKKKDEVILILKHILEERSQKKENLSKVDQVTKSSKDPAGSGTTATEGDEAHLLKHQIQTLRQQVEPSSLDFSSEDSTTGDGEYTDAVSVWPVSTPPPMVGTAPPPNHARYSTPHAATEQQRQPPHAGHHEQPTSPSLPTAAGDREEHTTYINVTRTARTEAFRDTVPSQESGGVTSKCSQKPEYIKAARKPTLRPDKSVLSSSTDSLGAKGEADGAPRRCGCGQTFAGDQGRQFVKHALTCPKGSPVGRPKTAVAPGRRVLQSQS